MSARVHALLVVRPDGRAPAAHHLRRTLASVREQSRPIDVLTVVLCGADDALKEIAAASGAEGVITAPRSTTYAGALRLATARISGDAVWLLAQDTAPEQGALAALDAALELAPSVAFVAPKLVRWDDRTEIVSLGATMTRLGRTAGLADGEFDQGQHDGRTDVLGADVRGLLVRADAWRSLGGLDTALAGADEGLDLGVRARLAGGRVIVAPTARVAVAGDGVAGLPAPHGGARIRRRTYAARVAQLHRRLVYAHAAAVPLLWLAILPQALWRTITDLIGKAPGRVAPEWGAAFVALARVGAVSRARRQVRTTRSTPWAQLAPLRITRTELNQRLDDDPDAGAGPVVRHELHFFSGGGAWAVLGALVLSIAVFPALLAWPVLGGGALEPLRATFAQLWTDAAYGLHATGLGAVGPADPFAGLLALLGSLWPGDPSRVLVALWVLALPLAVLGGWFAATRVTDRSSLRVTAAVVWALAPTFLAALVDGRPTGVLVHLLLPWLFYAGSVAHRSWAAAGAASLVFAAVVAAAPSLAPALVVLWALAVVLTVAVRAGRGAARVAWVVIPAAVISAPLVWTQLRAGNVWGLLADPGVTVSSGTLAADAGARALLAAGFPTADPGGWGAFLASLAPTAPEGLQALLTGPAWWVALLAAPLAIAALLAPLTQRWIVGTALLVISLLGIGTAIAVAGIAVTAAGGVPVAIWPGAGLSLAWLGATGAAVVTLDSTLNTGLSPGSLGVRGLARMRVLRGVAAGVIVIALAALAVPALTAPARGASPLTNGPASTLPAYVAAAGRDDAAVGTLVITPLDDGSVTSTVVWGGSETLSSHATVLETRLSAGSGDTELAAMTADVVTSTSDDVVTRLADSGISFVLLGMQHPDGSESDTARAFRLSAGTALDQRNGLDSVGDTTKGALWRVTDPVTPRAEAAASVQTNARLIALAQLAVIVIALLLAVPTAASRRQARRSPRVVGPAWQEIR